MKRNGFITSALLYGLLALFLVLMLGSLAILGNRKNSMDVLRKAALNDAEDATKIESFTNIWNNSLTYTQSGYVSDAKIDGYWTVNGTPSLVLNTPSSNPAA